jgi:hypothetical protein
LLPLEIQLVWILRTQFFPHHILHRSFVCCKSSTHSSLISINFIENYKNQNKISNQILEKTKNQFKFVEIVSKLDLRNEKREWEFRVPWEATKHLRLKYNDQNQLKNLYILKTTVVYIPYRKKPTFSFCRVFLKIGCDFFPMYFKLCTTELKLQKMFLSHIM